MERASEGGLVRSGVRWSALIPRRSFAIATTWSPEIATIELSKMVGQSSFFGGVDPVTPFVGAWVGDRFRFRVRPRMLQRSSLSPVIEAVVAADSRGALIHITMRLSFFVRVFMTLWMAGAVLGAFVLLGAALAGFLPGLLAPLLPICGALMCVGGFVAEARLAEALLRALFPPAFSAEGLPPYR